MKKIIVFLGFILMLSGCGKFNEKDLLKELKNKVEDSKSYQITATLKIFRNEETFSYDVVSSYKKGDYFKVDLVNKENNHEQIILKDENSVYVLTPSLNKSFKFQSDWPYNNSQIYLLQPVIKDIENDKETIFEKSENGYTIESKVNYSTEKSFNSQKIYFDTERNMTKIEILDESKNVKMSLDIINIEYDKNFDDDYFDINKYKTGKENKTESEINQQEDKTQNQTSDVTENEISNENTDSNNSQTSSINEIVYPMYVPTETYLTSQDVISTSVGERVILSFTGNSNFTLVQENIEENNNIEYVYGDPYLILDTVGAVTDNSISWISNGVEYNVMSDTMSVDELLTVAQSVSVEPVEK